MVRARMALGALIFDFDGTIADTFARTLAVLKRLAPEFGYRDPDESELPELRRLPPREVATRLGVNWHQLPLIAARVRRELLAGMEDVQPFAGIPEALATLRGRGLKLGVLTSNSRDNVERFLGAHSELSFDFISAGSGLFSKHRRLRALLKREQLSRSESAYVGDEVRDIEAAKQVGMRMIAVGWGFAAPQLLAAQAPDRLIMQPSELLSII